MELYKWHKGSELPDAECDCVVIVERKTRELVGTDDEITIIERLKYVTHVIVASDNLPRFVIYEVGMLSNKNIIAWMPIEFPREGAE